MKPTKQAIYSSRTADKFVVRLPDDMREKISEIARKHHRSMNSQIINWLSICVELEDAGVPVTRDTLAEVADILKMESDKPIIKLSYGEIVQVPEGYLHPEKAKEHRRFETETNIVEVFAMGRVAQIQIGTNGLAMVKLVWLHSGVMSGWIPFEDVRKI